MTIFNVALKGYCQFSDNLIVVNVDSVTTCQTIDGFGASDAWRTHLSGKTGLWRNGTILQLNDEHGGGGGRDLTMKTALYVARIIHHNMVLTNARSWQWWAALSESDFKDGLVYLLENAEGETGKTGVGIEYDGLVREIKLLCVMGDYSRFVRPGMIRIKCELSEKQSPVDGLLISAYKDPENGRLVSVFTNLSESEMKLDSGKNEKAKTYTTNEKQDMGFSLQKLNELKMPPRSVVTILN